MQRTKTIFVNKLRHSLVAAVSSFIFATHNLHAAPLRHLVTASDSSITQQTQGACGVYTTFDNHHWCGFSLFPENKTQTLRADALLRADEQHAKSTQDTLSGKMDKEDVQKLFAEDNFQSYSALARLEAQNEAFSLSYVPWHLTGAYHISNPSLPQLDLSASSEEVFRIGAGHEIGLPLLQEYYKWNVGASLSHYARTFYYFSGTALDLLVKPFDDLLDKRYERGWDVDASTALLAKQNGWPSVALRLEHLLALDNPENDEHLLSILPYYRRRGNVDVGCQWETTVGQFSLGVMQPLTFKLTPGDSKESVASAVYGIGKLRAFVSYSAYMNAFGFQFLASYYQVGIQYADEKQDNAIALQRQKNTYLFGTLFI